MYNPSKEKENINFVSDVAVTYKQPNVAAFVNNKMKANPILSLKILGVKFEEILDSKLLLVQTIQNGFTYKLFEQFKDEMPFTIEDYANFLDVSTKTLARYELANKTFKPIHTEKIFELAEVTAAGLDLFSNDLNAFNNWLQKPNFAFENLIPKNLLKDSYGKDLVLGAIYRLSHGIFI